MHYLKRGAAPRPLAPPARRIRPPLASLPRAGAGVAARQLMHTQELLEKIESNMVTEEVSFAITNAQCAFWVVRWPCGPGVSKSCYIGISIPIKYSNFSRFYKKLGPFYKKLRCDKFGN